MKSANNLRQLFLGAVAACCLCLPARGADRPAASAQMPPGVDVRMTIAGPVFEMQGRTLYQSDLDVPGESNCTSTPTATARSGDEGFVYVVPTIYESKSGKRPSCMDQWPLVRAQAGAHPVGKWTIIKRADGIEQWAYDSRPLYVSLEDEKPGDVDLGSAGQRRRPLIAPIGPPEFGFARNREGVVLADWKGHKIYTREETGGKSGCDQPCMLDLEPINAPTGAVPSGDWSLVATESGRQWAYKHKALYRYTGDEGGEVRGAKPIVLFPAPPPPAGVKINAYNQLGIPIYVDKDGMSLYTFSCTEQTKDRISCDRVGDTPVYYQGWCGGQEHCADTFRLLRAGPGEVSNALWSIKSVDPAKPMRALTAEEGGVRVWFYGRRPVLTMSFDTRPGDLNGFAFRNAKGTIRPIAVNPRGVE